MTQLKEKAVEELQLLDGTDSETQRSSKERIMKTVATVPGPAEVGQRSGIVDALSAKLESIEQGMRELVERRENLLLHACAELTAEGIEASIVSVKGWTSDFIPGARGALTEAHDAGLGTVRSEFIPSHAKWTRDWGPYKINDWLLQVTHGVYEVLFRDGDDILITQVESTDTEEAHARAVSRLRNLAKPEGMRIRVRDRQVRILSPFNSIVHTGDVVSAFRWLMGFEEASN